MDRLGLHQHHTCRRFDSATDPYPASLLYHQALADFAGLHDTRDIVASIARLTQSDAVKQTAKRDTLKALSLYALAQSIQLDNAQLCAEQNQFFRIYALRKSVAPELGCDRSH